jgi:predicted nucleotide-binding protein
VQVGGFKKVSYNKEKESGFLVAYKKWHDYNVEVYKTSFTVPNSTYRHDYESQEVRFLGADTIVELKESIHNLINKMKSDIEKIDLIPCQKVTTDDVKHCKYKSKNVFIVYGHDVNIRIAVENFVRSIGYNPIILCEQVDKGATIIEKIERETQNICFAIVIYTACDLGKDKVEEDLQPRARQNVVFEHGYMCAKLGRERVVALLENGIEQPGDLQGVIYKKIDGSGLWKYDIAREMHAVGIHVDFNNIR